MSKPLARLIFFASMATLIGLIAYSRWHEVAGFPLFVDEQFLLIKMTPYIQRGSIFVEAGSNRMFAAWWTVLFDLQGTQQIWIARVSLILFNLLGCAAGMATAQMLGGRLAALLMGLLLFLSPYELFFGRLLLSDSTMATWMLIALWLTLRYVYHPCWRWAFGVGIALAWALIAKPSALLLWGLPVFALPLLWPKRHHILRLWLGTGLGLAFILAPLLLLIRWRGYNYFGLASQFGTSQMSDLLGRFVENFGTWIEQMLLYISPALLLAIAIAACWLIIQRPKQAVFLLSLTIVPLAAAFATAVIMRSRYTAFAVPILLLWVAWGVAWAMEAKRRWSIPSLALYGLVWVWGIGIALPFHQQLAQDATALPLYSGDITEYFRTESAGYGLVDAVSYLRDVMAADDVAIGMVANCGVLQLMLEPARHVLCPDLLIQGQGQAAIDAQLNDLAATYGAGLWIVQEDLAFNQLLGRNFDWVLQASFPRPLEGLPVQVYRPAS